MIYLGGRFGGLPLATLAGSRSLAGRDTGVWGESTPRQNNAQWKIGFQSTESGAGEQFLMPDSRARARVKGVFFVHRRRYLRRRSQGPRRCRPIIMMIMIIMILLLLLIIIIIIITLMVIIIIMVLVVMILLLIMNISIHGIIYYSTILMYEHLLQHNVTYYNITCCMFQHIFTIQW